MTATTRVRGFDFHCHVDLFPDPVKQIARYERQRIYVLAVTTTPRAWQQNAKWTANSNYVEPAVGLHPELVGDRRGELAMLQAVMAETAFIGEVGLDGTRAHRGTLGVQRLAFSSILSAADRLGGKVLSIHSRWAADAVVSEIEGQTTPGRVIPILHWFSGSAAATKRAVAVGCYFSVNRRTLSHERGVGLVRTLPLERLLTETDAPLASATDGSDAAADALDTIGLLAAVRGTEVGRMARIVAANATRVCTFAGKDIRFEAVQGPSGEE